MWIRSVKGSDQRWGVFDVFGGFPSRRLCCAFEPFPLDEVLEAISASPRV